MKSWKLYLYLLFYCSPIVDALNGFLILSGVSSEGGIFSVGQIFRFIVTLFSFLFLREKGIKISLFFSLYFILIETLNFTIHQNLGAFTLGLIYSYKILYIVLIYFALQTILREEKSLNLISLIKYFRNGALIYAGILFASMALGIDNPTYTQIADAFGSKGLFASGNGLAVFLGISSIVAYYYYHKKQKFTDLLYFCVLISATVVVGTKASIIFLFISFFLMWWLSKASTKIISLVAVSCAGIYFYEDLFFTFSQVFDVIILRYENSESLFSFLASSRDAFIIDAFEKFNIKGFNIFRIFIGSGVFVSFRDYNTVALIYDTLETDFFDIFFAYGILGLIMYLTFILTGFSKAVKQKNIILAFAWLAIVTYSLLAGHTIFNAMSNFGLIFVYFILNNSDDTEKKTKKDNCIPFVERF